MESGRAGWMEATERRTGVHKAAGRMRHTGHAGPHAAWHAGAHAAWHAGAEPASRAWMKTGRTGVRHCAGMPSLGMQRCLVVECRVTPCSISPQHGIVTQSFVAA